MKFLLRVLLRVNFFHASENRVHFCLSLFVGDVIFESSETAQPAAAATFRPFASGGRNPQICITDFEKLELGIGNAYNGEAVAVECNRVADNGFVQIEAAFPELVGEDDDVVCPTPDSVLIACPIN